MRPLTASILVFITLVAAGCDWAGSARFRRSEIQNIPYIEGVAMKVETENGAVSIRRDDREDIEILAEVKAQTQERADQAVIYADRDDEGNLTIGVEWPAPGRLNSEGCRFEVLTPGAYNVTVISSNGRVDVEGLAGLADLKSSNGSVSIKDHDGDVSLRSSNGRVEAANITGDASLRSSNGRAVARNVGGSALADTSNGRIEIELDPNSKGPVFADTSNGSVGIHVGPAFGGDLSIKTSNGRVTVRNVGDARVHSVSKRSAHITFAEPGDESTIVTSNGSVTFVVDEGE